VFTAQYGLSHSIEMRLSRPLQAAPWVGRSVAGLSQWRPGFHPKAVLVRSITHKLLYGHVSLPVLRFSRQCHSSNAPYSSSSTCCSLPAGQTGEAWEPSEEHCSFGNRERWIEKYFHFFFHSASKESRSDTLQPLLYGDRSAFDGEIRLLPLQL